METSHQRLACRPLGYLPDGGDHDVSAQSCRPAIGTEAVGHSGPARVFAGDLEDIERLEAIMAAMTEPQRKALMALAKHPYLVPSDLGGFIGGVNAGGPMGARLAAKGWAYRLGGDGVAYAITRAGRERWTSADRAIAYRAAGEALQAA